MSIFIVSCQGRIDLVERNRRVAEERARYMSRISYQVKIEEWKCGGKKPIRSVRLPPDHEGPVL